MKPEDEGTYDSHPNYGKIRMKRGGWVIGLVGDRSMGVEGIASL